MDSDVGITKEFLEETLKIPVDKFVVNNGSNLGDGYMCIMYSVDVWAQGNDNPLPIIMKCFPSNAVRQKMLDDSGFFTTELRMYDTVIPDLEKFQDETLGKSKFRLPFAPFLAGQEIPLEKRNGPAMQLDNYIMMTDLRKRGGFSLRDRFKGLDLDHFRLVVEGQATLHAVSWAYKQLKGRKLVEMYPFLGGQGFASIFETFMDQFMTTIKKEIEVFKTDLKIHDGLRYLLTVATPATKLYFSVPLNEQEKHFTKDSVIRKPLKTVENEEPWEVLRHGDCWSNNLLFRYDPITGKPIEVIFIDLQSPIEGDPFGDLCYTLFVNGTRDLRKKHLTSLLHVYYDTFTEICERFSIPPFPGWSWEEFNRRFHRAQIVGVSMGAGALPVMLQDPNEVKDLEKLRSPEDNVVNEESTQELMSSMWGVNMESPVMKARLRGVLEDGVDAGVI